MTDTNHQTIEQASALDRISSVLTKLTSIDRAINISEIKSLIFIANHHDLNSGTLRQVP